ncbi:MAG: IS1182 family transposase [Terriglobales bacterium]
MSLPQFSPQGSLYSVDVLLGDQFPQNDRFRLFAGRIHPLLVKARSALEAAYCHDNGRPGIEPVLLLGVSLLQFMERVPDRQAVEMLKYHLGWKLALGLELQVAAFDPSTLAYFRQRLVAHDQAKLAFDAVLEGLREAGLVSKRSRQRLDSTHVLGLVARLSLLELLRETTRLALKELQKQTDLTRPPFWSAFWERYVESKVDYRLEDSTLRDKQLQAGQDMTLLLAWAQEQAPGIADNQQVQLLKRVLEENFQSDEGKLALHPQPSTAVKNPHDPDAVWCTKGTDGKKDWVGYKAQVAETVPDQPCQRGEPTTAFLTAIETQPATGSEEAGMHQVLSEQARSDMQTPAELFVDAGYVSAQLIAEARREGWELVGPAQEPVSKNKTFKSDAFDVDVENRVAHCPAGKPSTHCSRLEEKATGKASFRFEWGRQCVDCPLKEKCVSPGQAHRTLCVSENHTVLQERRREQKTEQFAQRMRQRNAIEGTHSELVRGHGLRRARYRGLAKVRFQNYLIGAACNAKRWIARIAWEIRQGAAQLTAPVAYGP